MSFSYSFELTPDERLTAQVDLVADLATLEIASDEGRMWIGPLPPSQLAIELRRMADVILLTQHTP